MFRLRNRECRVRSLLRPDQRQKTAEIWFDPIGDERADEQRAGGVLSIQHST